MSLQDELNEATAELHRVIDAEVQDRKRFRAYDTAKWEGKLAWHLCPIRPKEKQ